MWFDESERSIYEVIESARYPEDMVEGYDYSPIIGKVSVWNKLGDKLSSLERSREILNEGETSAGKFYTLRLDGHAFSKRMVQLKRLGILSDGYSNEFELIMKKVATKLLSSIQCALYAFTQSDELIVLVKPCEMDDHGNYCNFEFQRRRDKLVSIYASMATEVFLKEIFRLIFQKMRDDASFEIDFDAIPDVQFDARLAEYDTLSDAFQLILWRSFDCSVNGVSSGFVFSSVENKKSLMTMNSGEKLKYLKDHDVLATMSRHQLYGTFLYFDYYEVQLEDGRIRKKRRIVGISEQLVKCVKDNTLPVPFR